jgi:hypothetical protein
VANKEIRIPHDAIRDAQTITDVMERIFKENDLDLHTNEVVEISDDFSTGERVLQVSKKKYFVK